MAAWRLWRCMFWPQGHYKGAMLQKAAKQRRRHYVVVAALVQRTRRLQQQERYSTEIDGGGRTIVRWHCKALPWQEQEEVTHQRESMMVAAWRTAIAWREEVASLCLQMFYVTWDAETHSYLTHIVSGIFTVVFTVIVHHERKVGVCPFLFQEHGCLSTYGALMIQTIFGINCNYYGLYMHCAKSC